MAEAYTHLRIARAARGAFQLPGCEEAYLLGANGPDPFFAYKILSKHKPVPLPEIGSRMHTERCGEFLTELLARSETPAQKSYALGFLTHYAADRVFHPYVAACTAPGRSVLPRRGPRLLRSGARHVFSYERHRARRRPSREAAVMPAHARAGRGRGAAALVYPQRVRRGHSVPGRHRFVPPFPPPARLFLLAARRKEGAGCGG